MERLPDELVVAVASCPSLDWTDVTRLSLTCRTYHQLLTSHNHLWRLQFQRRWRECYQWLMEENGAASHRNWRSLFFECHRIAESTQTLVRGLSKLYYKRAEVDYSACDPLFRIIDTVKRMGYLIIIRTLESISCDSQSSDSNMTLGFYAQKIQPIIVHHWLKQWFKQVPTLTQTQENIEKCIIAINHWFRPRVNEETSEVEALDCLTGKVITHVQERWPHLRLEDNLKEPEFCVERKECRHILSSITGLVYSGENVGGFESQIQTSLQKLLVCACIARRLRISLEMVKSDSPSGSCEYWLQWLEHPELMGDDRYTYITFHSGEFCNRMTNSTYKASLIDIVQGYVHEVVSTSINANSRPPTSLSMWVSELRLLLFPNNVANKHQVCRSYIYSSMNEALVVQYLQDIQQLDPTWTGMVAQLYKICKQTFKNVAEQQEIKPKRRPTHCPVLLAVGLVVTHKKYRYNGVICGWDEVCSATEEWQHTMGVAKLPRGSAQPFYNVLSSNGSEYYAAEENLLVCQEMEGIQVDHPSVAQYFDSYDGRRYLQNEENKLEYPDDEDVCLRFISDLLSTLYLMC